MAPGDQKPARADGGAGPAGGGGFSLAAAPPLAQIRSPGLGASREAASSLQRRISRGGGGRRDDGLALVPRDVGARLQSLKDEVRDVRLENRRLKEGISKEELQATSNGGLENHLLRHALKKTKEELHEERTVLAQNRETHLLQQLEQVMKEKNRLSALVDELSQENQLLKDKVEYLQTQTAGTPQGKGDAGPARLGFRLGSPPKHSEFGGEAKEPAAAPAEPASGATGEEGGGWGDEGGEGWGDMKEEERGEGPAGAGATEGGGSEGDGGVGCPGGGVLPEGGAPDPVPGGV